MKNNFRKIFNGFFKTVRRNRFFLLSARALCFVYSFHAVFGILEIVLAKLNILRIVASMFVLRSAGSLIVSV